LRSGIFICGLVAVLLLKSPLRADDGPPSMIAIAEALRGGHPQDAETLATQMMAAPNLTPLDNAYLHMNRGLAREKLGRRDEALADFAAAIDAKVLPSEEQARALFDRGVTLDETGRTELAIADYSQAISIMPRYATALNNRGNAYRRMKKFDLARADYAAALAAGDDEPEFPLYGLGRIAEAQDDPVLAQGFYNKALAANAGYTPASDRIAKLATASAPQAYSLREPDSDASVQVNLPVAAPTAPVTQSDTSPQVDLHPPPLRAPLRVAARKPEDNRRTITSFGLRPAILDSAHTEHASRSVRVASIAPQMEGHSASSMKHGGMPHSSTGSAMIQLGAWRNQADAADGWNHFVGKSDGLLSGMVPRVVAADIPGQGRFWRLRAELSSGEDATTVCEQLRAKGLACIVAKS
jgi:tetratricopeptide (TPR) repeat protein